MDLSRRNECLAGAHWVSGLRAAGVPRRDGPLPAGFHSGAEVRQVPSRTPVASNSAPDWTLTCPPPQAIAHTPGICKERQRLFDLYGNAVEYYAQMTSILMAATSRTMQDFRAARAACHSALATVREARKNLRSHCENHGC